MKRLFLIPIAIYAWTLIAFFGFSARSSADDTIGFFLDTAIPQHAFAANDIRAALEARKISRLTLVIRTEVSSDDEIYFMDNLSVTKR